MNFAQDSSNELKVCKVIHNKFERLPQITLEECNLTGSALSISYIDSISFTDDEVEDEIFIYLVYDLVLKYGIERVDFNIKYPNREHLPNRKVNLDKETLYSAIQFRYIDNPAYIKVVEELLTENSGRRFTINTLSYLYGFVSEENPKYDEYYSRSIFHLLYACLLDKKNGVCCSNYRTFEKIYNAACNMPKNSEFARDRVLKLQRIIEFSYPPPAQRRN
jgi:hypothetical protein